MERAGGLCVGDRGQRTIIFDHALLQCPYSTYIYIIIASFPGSTPVIGLGMRLNMKGLPQVNRVAPSTVHGIGWFSHAAIITL